MTNILGKGTYGCVRKEINQRGEIIARKTLVLTPYEDEDIELIRRFTREVKYQSKFNHPNIVRIVDSNLEIVPPYFDMPLAVCHLGQEIKHNCLFDYNTKIKAFLDTLNAIGYIHNDGHTHRDIKPANILRFHDNFGGFFYSVSDFGLITPSNRDETSNITSTGITMGTQFFMAPECFIDAKKATNQSDIYSLGVLLLWLFGNESEFGLPFEERYSECIFGNIIQKCTKRKINERYESIAELENDIKAILAKLPKGARI